jgi:hypothetical protein
MDPTLVLGVAAALFAAPAIYMLSASMLSQQSLLGGAPISDSAQVAIWCAGGACLVAPLAFPMLLRSFARSTQLILALVVAVAASVLGLVLTFATGNLAPVRVFGVASMLAILGWSWAFRECFRAPPIEQVVTRYTTVLLFVGAVSLLFAAFRVARWEHFANSTGGHPLSAFTIFADSVVGIATLSVARLRKLGSPYARPGTIVLSWTLLGIPLLGTLAAVYWLIAARRQEQLVSSSAHAA